MLQNIYWIKDYEFVKALFKDASANWFIEVRIKNEIKITSVCRLYFPNIERDSIVCTVSPIPEDVFLSLK